ncbi:unnamed protein product [Cuscuta epithymum]|uniref:NAC domain-containing protein n=1 Tax=Cuscuta epithymum TaxID=186058 RepID=A0AAV0E414_9ASTE|nr:unnamed protein product [Cuscuta epithymum]CAH9147021.1 unnamed protein product [Cuscuta epithymum]
MKGYKKILVLYTNYGKQRKPEKTNWVMHQYHLGDDEDEKEGELVASKIFYQTQPRQCSGSISKDSLLPLGMANEGHEAAGRNGSNFREATMMESFNPTLISFGQYNHDHTTARLLPSFNIHDTPFIP